MNEKTLTTDEVLIWLAAVESDMGKLSERLAPLLDEQRRLEERKALLQSLIRSFEQTAPNESTPSRGQKGTGSVARYVTDRAVEILRDEGRPLHINDLHAKFVERGFIVPGAGKPVNLIVHLRGAKEIASPMRGIYGLADQVGAVARKPRPAKRRKTARSGSARGRHN